jgi:hypothetical protein
MRQNMFSIQGAEGVKELSFFTPGNLFILNILLLSLSLSLSLLY